MRIMVFKHKRQANETAVDMLADAGRAVLIYPIGTGKSRIPFKLARIIKRHTFRIGNYHSETVS